MTAEVAAWRPSSGPCSADTEPGGRWAVAGALTDSHSHSPSGRGGRVSAVQVAPECPEEPVGGPVRVGARQREGPGTGAERHLLGPHRLVHDHVELVVAELPAP